MRDGFQSIRPIRAPSRATPPAALRAGHRGSNRPTAAAATARLLVVDDEDINRDIIAEYLEDADYDLVMAEGGERALQLLRKDARIDAVILDRMMPHVDGLEVLKHMQADPRLSSIPVIMQTAAAGHEQVAEGLRSGAYYYLTKPYHRDALLAVVHSALDAARRRRELSREIEQYQGVIALMQEGCFRLRTLRQANELAAAISSLGAEPSSAALGLAELLINAIEHGNLGISFHEKASLLASDTWEAEVDARHALPANADKFVEVQVRREPPVLRVSIRDHGAGFDWRPYLKLDESRALYPNGRGIAMARHVAFRSLHYVEPGNEVVVTLMLAR
jgi:CheY-like chemotaxis protein